MKVREAEMKLEHHMEAAAARIKKIMNNVYHELSSEFDDEESYLGADVSAKILEAIKTNTVEALRAFSGKV